jgi:hypothetical protein
MAFLKPIHFSRSSLRYPNAFECEAYEELRERKEEEGRGKYAEEDSIIGLFEAKKGIYPLPKRHDAASPTVRNERLNNKQLGSYEGFLKYSVSFSIKGNYRHTNVGLYVDLAVAVLNKLFGDDSCHTPLFDIRLVRANQESIARLTRENVSS